MTSQEIEDFEKYMQNTAIEKMQKAYYEYFKHNLDNNICFFVPYYFYKILEADRFNGFNIRIGYEDKIIISNVQKINSCFKYLID